MKFNMCSYFLPQLIGINKNIEGFINCYIDSVEDESTPFEHIYILMDKSSSLLDIYPYTVDKIEKDNGNLYKISISDRYKKDLLLFYKGEYSKLSESAKRVMIDNSGIDPEKSLSYHVLYKTKVRKDYIEKIVGQELFDYEEVMSILNLKNEIYGN